MLDFVKKNSIKGHELLCPLTIGTGIRDEYL
jgi:hypothetical protein